MSDCAHSSRRLSVTRRGRIPASKPVISSSLDDCIINEFSLPAVCDISPAVFKSNQILKKPNQCLCLVRNYEHAVEEMTNLPPNLASISCTSCSILPADTTSNPGAYLTDPPLKDNSPPLRISDTQTLSANCHQRRSSCVTRLAVMRLSVSGALSRRKSSAALDELKASRPSRVRQTGRERDRKSQRMKERQRIWRLPVTMVILLFRSCPDSLPSFPCLPS